MNEAFELKVRQQVERLQKHSCRMIEAEVTQKRQAWCVQNLEPIEGQNPPTPRLAFERLFFDYMRLSPDQLQIVSESETEIVWLSRNPCPTLEAVQILGLDTRQVCRLAYEKSTQAFVSQLDPQLRFLRDYHAIRPYTDSCKEMIVRVDFTTWMRAAIHAARQSAQAGTPGSGALVVLGKRLLGQAHASLVAGGEPSQHAVAQAIHQGRINLGDPDLSGAILFSTCKPCPQCLALAMAANLTTVVYGNTQGGDHAQGQEAHPKESESAAHPPAWLEVIGGVLQPECARLYPHE